MIFQNIFDPAKKVAVEQDDLLPETEIPELERSEPGFFDGMGDTWKSIPHSALSTASSAITVLQQIPLEKLTSQPEVRDWVRQQREEVMPENARQLRKIAKQDYELDPQAVGTAAQIVYGLGEVIPKAALYGALGGPAGGALLFGADTGVNRAQTLMDEGVDEETAINAGMITFAAGAIGLKLPAAFETGRRITSAAIGAGANVGLNVAEVQGIHWALENQNYDELAKNYELSFADNAVAAGLGAAFGAGFWRPTTRVRFTQQREALSERFSKELERTGKFTPEQVTAQANLNATVVTSAASRWGLTPEQVSEVAPRVRVESEVSSYDALFQEEIPSFAELPEMELIVVAKGDNGVEHRVWGTNGDPNLTVLPEGIEGVKPLPVRLQESTLTSGHLHGHEDSIKAAGYESVEQAVWDVAQNYVRIYKGAKEGQIILARPIKGIGENPKKAVLYTEFQEVAGAYRVGSALVSSNPRYLQNRKLLWDKSHSNRLRQEDLTRTRGFTGPEQSSSESSVSRQNLNVKSEIQRALGAYSPSENRITLTPNANISTFSHEVGHWYLHKMMLASQVDGVADSVKQDVDVLLRAFGIESVDAWNALGVEGQRKYHERFASWVEQYLSEGKSPSPSLVSFFRRFGEWIKDVYEQFAGVGEAVSSRYKDEFGEAMPELSAEVRKVLDRMYTDEFGSRTVRPTKAQIAAARAVQTEEINREKRGRILASDGEDAYSKALSAQRKAAIDLNSGEKVDVSRQMRGVSLNEAVLGAQQKSFAREIMSGDGQTAVVLQNRDRSNVVSIGQVNAIASDPQYGLLSFSRSTSSGAPIVSFGPLPDDSHTGNVDYVVDAGEQIPVQYAVVEADTIQTSNRFDGSQNPDYGMSDLTSVVAGNGRMTGLTEAYRRGTAQKYRDTLTADPLHGIPGTVIAQMQHPVLVRFMPQEKVTSGFVSRSNSDQVMARSSVEIAVEDAPRIRENASLYRFDEDGAPAPETVRQFLIDIGEPNALGRLINSSGRPTPEAIRRIQAAVFQEAYQNEALTELFAATTDVNIKRILTAMASFAPRVIEMRAAGVDLARGFVEAANYVRMAREQGKSLEELLGQVSYLDDPATDAFLGLLVRNANSAAAIMRVLNPLADWATNALRASDGGLFGAAEAVRIDFADVLGQLRRFENEQRVDNGLEPLPALNVEEIRRTVDELQAQAQQNLQTVANAAPDAAPAVADVPEQQQAPAPVESVNPPDAADAQAQVRDGVANDPEAIQMRELIAEKPEQTFLFEDEDGQVTEIRYGEVEERMQRIENEAKRYGEGVTEAGICIIKNEGIENA